MKKILTIFLCLSILSFSIISSDINTESQLFSTYEGNSEYGGASESASIVNPMTGDLMRHEVDLSLDGPIPVMVQRTYNSGPDYEKVESYAGTHDFGNWQNHQGEIVYQTYVSRICDSGCYDLGSYEQDLEDPHGITPPVLTWNMPDGTVRTFYYDSNSNPLEPFDRLEGLDGSFVIIPVYTIYKYETMEGDVLTLTYTSDTTVTMDVVTNEGLKLEYIYQKSAIGWSINEPSIYPAFWDIDLYPEHSHSYYPIYRVFQLTKMEDLFGNKVSISHQIFSSDSWIEGEGDDVQITNYSQQSRIISITDAYERKLKYQYLNSHGKVLSKIYLENAESPLEVNYTYNLVNTQKLINNGYTTQGGGYYLLTQVSKPGVYSNWKYSYATQASGAEETNYLGTVKLIKVENSNYGLNESYVYGTDSFPGGKKEDGSICYNIKPTVRKIFKDSYRGYIKQIIYTYNSGNFTSVVYNDEDVKDLYYYYHFEDDIIWRSGLLQKKIRYDHDIKEETTFSYTTRGFITQNINLYSQKVDRRYGTSCSYDNRQAIHDNGIQRIGIEGQVVKSKKGDNSDYTDTTSYSDFDSYNNWQLKEEIGTDGILKTTKRTYWYNEKNNIVKGKVEKEEICFEDDESTCSNVPWLTSKNIYLETGLVDKSYNNTLLSKDVDYEESSNRIHRVYDGNGNYHEYGSYTYGEIAKTESISGYKTITDRKVRNDGMVVSETNILNQITGFNYSENQTLESVSKPLEKDMEIEYSSIRLLNASHDTLHVLEKQGNTYLHKYLDGLGRVVFETNELGHGKKYYYNGLDRLSRVEEWMDCSISSSLECGILVRTGYFDEKGRKSSVEENGGEVFKAEYNDTENTITQTDGVGNQTKLTYESFGHVNNQRLKTKVEGIVEGSDSSYRINGDSFSFLGVIAWVKNGIETLFLTSNKRTTDSKFLTGQTITEYVYNINNQMSKIKINDEVIREYEYNNTTKRLTKEIKKESDNIEYTYDNVGNLKSKKTGNGTLYYFYNSRNLVSKIADNTKTYYQIQYDDAGRKKRVVDPQNNLLFTYTYDEANRIIDTAIWEVKLAKKGSNQTIERIAFVVTNEYNEDGLLSKLYYPDGSWIEYIYNDKNQVTQVKSNVYGSNSEILIQELGYTTYGSLKNMNYGNSSFPDSFYYYDERFRLKHYTVYREDGSRFLDKEYYYNNNNLVKQISDFVINGNFTYYTYDSMNRLTYSKGKWGELEYGYDDLGNRVSEKLTDTSGNRTRDKKYYYKNDKEDKNRLTDIEDGISSEKTYFEYDPSGNNRYKYMIQGSDELKSEERYFDLFGRISEYVDLKNQLETTYYTYTMEGDRIKKTGSKKSTWMIRDSFGNVIYETNLDQTEIKRHYYLGSKRFMTESPLQGSKQVYYTNSHEDVIGTVTIVNGDSVPKEEWIFDEPFGKQSEHMGSTDFESNYGMEGMEEDEESGLQYFGARYYDSEIGKFLSNDPVDGKIGDSSQNFNLYSYSHNNPVNTSDPSGMNEVYETSYGTYSADELVNSIDGYSGERDGDTMLSELSNQIESLYSDHESIMEIDNPKAAFRSAVDMLGYQALIRNVLGRPIKVWTIQELADDVFYVQSGEAMKDQIAMMAPGGIGKTAATEGATMLMSGTDMRVLYEYYYNKMRISLQQKAMAELREEAAIKAGTSIQSAQIIQNIEAQEYDDLLKIMNYFEKYFD